jgi:hypothetical protein
LFDELFTVLIRYTDLEEGFGFFEKANVVAD